MIHIAIEGMDGVGKSTVCKMLAKHLGYKFIEKSLHFLFDGEDKFHTYTRIRDKVNKSSDRLFTSWFYGLGNIYLYTMFGNENIITDRHFLSNYAWSGNDDNIEVYDLLVKKLGFPDLTVILYADEKTIFNRLKGRNKNDSDLYKIKESNTKYKKMFSFCKRYKMPYVKIDNSNLTPEQTVEKIIKLIKDIV